MLRFLLLAALLAGTGCGPAPVPPPKTYPVTGKVIFRGGQPVSGGMLEFRSTDPSVSTSGAIAADGTFALRTITPSAKQPLEGAVEGTFKVTVNLPPPPGSDKDPELAQAVQFVEVRQTYKVEPKENHFIIEVEKAGR